MWRSGGAEHQYLTLDLMININSGGLLRNCDNISGRESGYDIGAIRVGGARWRPLIRDLFSVSAFPYFHRGNKFGSLCDSTSNVMRYRYQYYFRYQIFLIPIPVLFSVPNFSNTGSQTFFPIPKCSDAGSDNTKKIPVRHTLVHHMRTLLD